MSVGEVQFAAVAAVALIGGSLMPWVDSAPPIVGSESAVGIDYNAGELTFLIGVAALLLLTRMVDRVRDSDALALAALGLLAGAPILVKAFQVHDQAPVSIAWGMYLSGVAALALLIAGLILMGHREDPAPPD